MGRVSVWAGDRQVAVFRCFFYIIYYLYKTNRIIKKISLWRLFALLQKQFTTFSPLAICNSTREKSVRLQAY